MSLITTVQIACEICHTKEFGDKAPEGWTTFTTEKIHRQFSYADDKSLVYHLCPKCMNIFVDYFSLEQKRAEEARR
jgi:hypothetical protein